MRYFVYLIAFLFSAGALASAGVADPFASPAAIDVLADGKEYDKGHGKKGYKKRKCGHGYGHKCKKGKGHYKHGKGNGYGHYKHGDYGYGKGYGDGYGDGYGHGHGYGYGKKGYGYKKGYAHTDGH